MSPIWKISLFENRMRKEHTKNSTTNHHILCQSKIFGEIGIVRVYDKKIKAKLDDRGLTAFSLDTPKITKMM